MLRLAAFAVGAEHGETGNDSGLKDDEKLAHGVPASFFDLLVQSSWAFSAFWEEKKYRREYGSGPMRKDRLIGSRH